MSKDGKHFHSDSLQHVLNGAYDKNNRNLRITVAPDPPFRPSDILPNVNPLEIDASLFPLPSNPYPIAVLSVVDNDVNDSFEWSIVGPDNTYFALLKNPSDENKPILVVSDEVEKESPGAVLSFVVRVCDSFGLCYEKTFSVPVVASASTSGPTDIELTDFEVADNSDAGSYVAQLSSVGGLAGYVYSIVDDPDSKFSISGDLLNLQDDVSRNKAIRHSVTLRSTDANAVSVDKTVTIGVSGGGSSTGGGGGGSGDNPFSPTSDTDTITVNFVNPVTENWEFRQGGDTGAILKTVQLEYTNSSKSTLSRVRLL
jgi:hypothetical protein